MRHTHMAQEVIAHRHGRSIIMFPNDKAARQNKTYRYINEAKRVSRQLSEEHGHGAVRVVQSGV